MSTTPTWHFAQRAAAESGSAIREIAKQVVLNPRIITFAGGLPSPDTFPIELLRECYDRVLLRNGRAALQYSGTDGFLPLRDWIAKRLRAKGMEVNAENVLITSGSQQGLDLVGRVLVEPGDPMYVELPTYVGATQALRSYGPYFHGVASDEHGLVVERLAEMAARRPGRPGLLYTVPNFQNPSGRTLTTDRRKGLMALAQALNMAVVEDDPYGELAFDGTELPTLYSIDPTRVIYLGSFSKILCPGIRLGYVVAPLPVVRRMEQVKQGLDLHTATLTQMAVHELIADGALDVHLPQVRSLYSRQAQTMQAAIAAHFPAQVKYAKPTGGMFLWLELPAHVDTTRMLAKALEVEVAYVPGGPFHVDGSGLNTMRLSFANAGEQAIQTGIARLGQVITDHVAHAPLPAQRSEK